MKRILVIEDNADLRSLIQLALQAEGFEVAVAEDGDSALAALQRNAAEIIVTDLFMPNKDGIETIVEVRKQFPQAKIIAMTGWDSSAGSDYLKVAREIGAEKSLRKPFELDELINAVRDLS